MLLLAHLLAFKYLLAEVYIERSAIITKGEKGREMWQKNLVYEAKLPGY